MAVQYDSKSLGTRRQVRVYTPPGSAANQKPPGVCRGAKLLRHPAGFASGKKYPVLYLRHGIGGNDREWIQACHADIVIDNLLADGRIQPMIMVFPNGNSSVKASGVGEFAGEGGGAGPGAAAGAGARGDGTRGGFDSWGRHSRMPCSTTLFPSLSRSILCLRTATIAPWPGSPWAEASP
jgi:hypothetical protein